MGPFKMVPTSQPLFSRCNRSAQTLSPCHTADNFTSLNQVIENCPVTGIQVRTDDLGMKKVKAVETPHGTIETPCVVNCAGEGLLNRFFKTYNAMSVALTRSWLSAQRAIPSCKSVTQKGNLLALGVSVYLNSRYLIFMFSSDCSLTEPRNTQSGL